MNRLQKKCLVATLALHALLVAVLLFGAALMPEAKPVESAHAPIHVYDSSTVSMVLASRGGSPNVAAMPMPAAPTPPTPAPAPTPVAQPPQPRAAPEPVKPPEIPKPEPKQESFLKRFFEPPERIAPVVPDEEPAPKPKHKVVIDPTSLTPVKRQHKPKTDEQNDEQSEAAARAQARAEAHAAARAAAARARAIDEIAHNIGENLSSETHVEAGVGGGGAAVTNYRDIVAGKYTRAWTPPADIDDDAATTTVAVTIARDGSVISARITHGSGNSAMDHSIKTTLENLTFIEPFPAGVNDSQMTFTIKFNLQAKRSLG